MTHENGFLVIHVKRGTFDFLLDGTLTETEWAKIMLQIMERLKAAMKDKPKDTPVGAGTFRPLDYNERLKKLMQ